MPQNSEKATDWRADPRIESRSFGAMRPVAQEIHATAISFPAREGLLRTQGDRQLKARGREKILCAVMKHAEQIAKTT
jgi:hypothetical protein